MKAHYVQYQDRGIIHFISDGKVVDSVEIEEMTVEMAGIRLVDPNPAQHIDKEVHQWQHKQ